MSSGEGAGAESNLDRDLCGGIEMIFRCKIKNGPTWTEIEVIGDRGFKDAFWRRFGNPKNYEIRDVQYLDPYENKWKEAVADE